MVFFYTAVDDSFGRPSRRRYLVKLSRFADYESKSPRDVRPLRDRLKKKGDFRIRLRLDPAGRRFEMEMCDEITTRRRD